MLPFSHSQGENKYTFIIWQSIIVVSGDCVRREPASKRQKNKNKVAILIEIIHFGYNNPPEPIHQFLPQRFNSTDDQPKIVNNLYKGWNQGCGSHRIRSFYCRIPIHNLRQVESGAVSQKKIGSGIRIWSQRIDSNLNFLN